MADSNVRKYEILARDGVALGVGNAAVADCERVTAIDDRDLRALLEAARAIAKRTPPRGLAGALTLAHVPPAELHALSDALAPFLSEEP